MTLQEIIMLAVGASMFLLVFALGAQATWADATSLFKNPGLLLRSITAMNIVMVVVVVVAALIFNLPPALKIALVALAASPVPPILPGKQQKAGGRESYAIGLLCAASIISIVLVPIAIALVSLLTPNVVRRQHQWHRFEVVI